VILERLQDPAVADLGEALCRWAMAADRA